MARVDIAGLIDPQMAAALRKQEELAPGLGVMSDLGIEAARALYIKERVWWNEGGPALASVEGRAVPGPFRHIPVRVYYPEASAPPPVLVYLHGGGWIVGNLDTHDRICRRLALRSGAAVVAVDYVLSPEHKFPRALDEAVAVVRHVAAAGADWGLDPARLALGGDSAGANMSVAAALAVAGEGPVPVRAGILFYGGFGLRDSVSRRKYGGPEDGMGAKDLAFYMNALVRTPADLDDPRFDVLAADLSVLPPLFVAAAEIDPLLDDSRALADLLADAGVEHRLTVYPGVFHGFVHLGRMVDAANTALDDAAGWLAGVLGR